MCQALAQDQRAALEQLLLCCPGLEHIKVRLSDVQSWFRGCYHLNSVQVATYDGDTPKELRQGLLDPFLIFDDKF
jgi:DEAD/DEAH box helicase domain-containing protein